MIFGRTDTGNLHQWATVFLVLLFTATYSQDNEILAKSYYLQAEEAYSNGNNNTALENLHKTVEHLGGTNARVEALYVRTFQANGKLYQAKDHLNTYFELADPSHGDYNDMVRMVATLKDKIEAIQKKQGFKGNLINGKREGKWEFYWSNGDLQQTVTYKNDVPVNGVKLFFDKDWKKITDNNKDKFAYYRVIAYENGKWTNPVRDYYANGTLQMEAYYRSVELAISSEENLENEVIDNTPVKFFHKNGKLQRIVHFLNGKKHGEEKTYHNNGKLEASGFFVDGKREGLFKYNTKYNYSWDNGKPSSSEHYVKDKREGECKYYYKNGELNTSGFFVDGKREGEFKYYWDNGDLKQTVTYKNNLPVSDLKLFFDKDWKETKDKDKLAYYRVIKYENGKWANPIKDHYANGTLQMEAYYKSEELALSTEGNVESKVINETPVKWFYRNGKLQKVAHFLNGTKDGEYKSYYENGQLQYEIHYYIDIETGVFNWYHSNGQLLRSTKYQHEPFDKKNWDGLHKHTYAVEAIAAFDKYGNKLDKGTLKKGRGTLHLYDENGNLEKSIKIKNGYQVEESTTKKL